MPKQTGYLKDYKGGLDHLDTKKLSKKLFGKRSSKVGKRMKRGRKVFGY